MAAYVQYLTAERVSNGQYGTFDISGSGAFTYTPYSWVFDSPDFMGLEDSCLYVAKDPTGKASQPGTVKVDLVDIYIARNGVNVDTNPSQLNVEVGQKVYVAVAIKGDWRGNRNIQWSAPSSYAVDGYSGFSSGQTDPRYTSPLESGLDIDGVGNASVQQLDIDEFHSSGIDFYWVDGGAKDVSVTVTAPGMSVSDTASFQVFRPNVEVTSTINQVHYNQFTSRVRLGYSDETGITFTRTIDPAAMGTFRWTQLVDYYGARTDSNGNTEWWRKVGLDFRPSLNTELNVNDSPSTALLSNVYRSYTFEFSANMYLMYRPNYIDSIWVPIKVVDWSWSIELKKPVDNPNGSFVVIHRESEARPAVDTTDFPTWDHVVLRSAAEWLPAS